MGALKSITIGQCSLMNCQVVEFKSISAFLLVLFANSLDLLKLESIDLSDHALYYDISPDSCISDDNIIQPCSTLTMHGNLFSIYCSYHPAE